VKTETLDFGTAPSEGSAAAGGGIVTLFAPDPGAIPSAIPLGDRPLLLGRDPPPGGVRLPFTSVSRVHARIARRGAEVVLDDLDSRNGSFVNGARVGRAFLEADDEVRIGEVCFKLVPGEIERYAAYPLAGVAPAPPLEALRGGPAIERVRREILRTAGADLSVLVLGETGTGKELVARALHGASGRTGRLSTVNCAAIPPSLLESELFGYKRGAFTGADRDRIGIVQSAEGGTLFLDEIGDMPLDAQAKLLRMIETRAVTPLGSHLPLPVDVRIVCATHRPLVRFVREERFRADLFARISGHTIALPPLRDRKEDIYQLAHAFLARAASPTPPIGAAFMLGLLAYDWPFNVRELEAAIKRAVALADGPLGEAELPPGALDALKGEASSAVETEPSRRGAAPPEATLRALLERHRGNIAAVARELKKDRVQVHRWLKRHGISLEDFRG